MVTPNPNLSLIAAVADNGVIGIHNRLPWHLPADLAHFKRLTLGKPIIMGRKTWESLPGLLPHRTHVIVTRNPDYQAEGGFVVHSLEEALDTFGDVEELMVVGGADLYAQALPLASRLYLTEVHAKPEGDSHFPPFDRAEWKEVERVEGRVDERNPIPHSFVIFQRSSQ
ncbi:MAG: dihydrofolate reductase [Gammaproteobacteria bacterium]|nr:MAG: dihydrofolate reductase [Gammaproteobacteria bacterium]